MPSTARRRGLNSRRGLEDASCRSRGKVRTTRGVVNVVLGRVRVGGIGRW